MITDGRVDEVKYSEDTITAPARGRGRVASPGSESTACSKSAQVNVGDPGDSSGKEVPVAKGNSENTGMAARKSDGA